MLDTHNTMKVAPDGEIEVVPERGPYSQRYDHPYKWDASGPECGVCGAVHEPNLEPLTTPA